MTPVRLSAEERRDEIVAAAAIEFASSGYTGTSTEAIARRAGVSQPYLFQLFGTKKELFICVVRDCFERTGRTFRQSGKVARDAGLATDRVLAEMGQAYMRLLLGDPNLLRLQLQAYAACQDADIRTAVRANYRTLWQTVTELSGADQKAIQAWFAQGMLMNVVATIGEGSTFEEFLASLLGGESQAC